VTDTAATPGAFDSGLTTADFAACLSMGLAPIGLVQGFYCGQVSGWSSYTSDVTHRYYCPHGYRTQEHPPPDWLGTLRALDEAWTTCFYTALQRMLEEAAGKGAHGVVGVATRFGHPTSQHSCETHIFGTAVRSVHGPPPPYVWTTRLAGHKLAKLVEAGFVPHGVVYARNTSVLYEGCIMEGVKQGQVYAGTTVDPLRDVHHQARDLVMRQAREATRGESLYDVVLEAHESEGARASFVTCTLLGSAVRKVRHTLPLPEPIATVTLSDAG
jgi:hypothetical protein